MEKPETAIMSDLPDLTGTSLEDLRSGPDESRAAAKARLLADAGRAAGNESPGSENGSWTV
ncbi:hypothetical protein AMK26_23135 [Streptomyces sp. CB03234]|uniref:hypothetical protein n=1 Tax=Streptomyces sp. (strain CB03234) TaxID=1703937 RepID=UPI00093E3653|nr:hypothetical protein [Streptomyces sp. CB03234]OKK02533.1 hypothetical protein AMK26_23135 [Streptomyces sp. CB03234]